MNPEDLPPLTEPLFGNKAGDLMRAAVVQGTLPATDPASWQPPRPEELQLRLSGYEVHEFLARGGMGAVYRGVQTSLGRQVAIKILPPQLRDADPHYAERFKQEARSMAQLNHPGIVSVHDFGEMTDGTLYFIMEFIDGTDVGQMVSQQGRLSSAHAMAIAAHVCDALQYAHEHGVIHRDIKPANIMVGRDGRVKVADFGLAKSVQSATTNLTVTGHVMGTPHFVAPEALRLGMSIDHRADIYAVGVMLYQMLTGKLPQGVFEMPSLQVPGLDPRYDAIVASAMREDREQRYQKILDMRHALDAIMTQPVQRSGVAKQTIPPTAATQAQTPRKPQPGQRQPRPPTPAARSAGAAKSSAGTWIISTAVVLGLGVIGWMNLPKPAAEDPTAETPSETSVLPAKAMRGHLADLIVPFAPFKGATAAEAITFLERISRDLDPARKGISILADEPTRNASVAITMDVKDAKLGDLIEYLARLARWEVSYVGEAIRLTSSSSIQPPFPAGAFADRLQRQGEVVLPAMPFARATLEEAAEFIRGKGKQEDPLHQHINLLIDPALVGLGPTITADMKNVTVSAALAYISGLCGGEVVYVGEAFYLQPTAKKLSAGDPNASRASTAQSSPKGADGGGPPTTATKDNPFINSLGMKFVSVPGTNIRMCIHETRRKDFAAYALQVPGVPASWKTMRYLGHPSGHEDAHPVVGVNWDDANAFCQWLSQTEHLNYRLPTDQEWSIAAGLQEEHSPKTTPEMLDHLILNHFPWGSSGPPKDVSMAGNYVDTAYIETFKTDPKHLEGMFVLGHTDGFPTTAPVMSFQPNALGLYDLGGNVREWCADWYHAAKQWRVLRGSSWQGFRQEDLLTSGRAHITPQSRLEDCGFRCVIDASPSTQQEAPDHSASPSSTSNETGVVKLEFKNAERFYDIGGYHSSEVVMSSTAPPSVSRAPANLNSPLYGEFRLGAANSQRRYPILLNHPRTEKAALYIDTNANGDLTDDAPAKWQPGQQSNASTGSKWDVFQGEFMVDLKHADGIHPARFEVYQNASNGSTSESLWIHPQYGRVGTVTLGNRQLNALLYDDQSKGDFTAPSSTFRLDLVGGGGFRWEEAEAFPVTEFFTVEGKTYQLSGLTPGGESFKIVPSQGWVGQSAPALTTKSIAGDTIDLPFGYKGKLVLVHFWSIGQKLGLDDLPNLKAAYAEHHSGGFEMVGFCIEYRKGKEMLPAFVKDYAVDWPQVCEYTAGAMDHPILKLFKTHSVPTNFLIDGDSGKVIAMGLHGADIGPSIAEALQKRSSSRAIPTANTTRKTPLDEDLRTFTNTKGQTIRAALIRINGEDIVLRKDDGSDYIVKSSALSASDIDFLKTKGLVVPQERVLSIPEESQKSILLQTTLFGLSRQDAANLLADTRLKENPQSVLESLQTMVSNQRAAIVSNLSVSASSGVRNTVEGSYGCESDIVMSDDGGLKVALAITSMRSPGSPSLTSFDIVAKRGATVFLGSFEDDNNDPKMPVRLAFVTFH